MQVNCKHIYQVYICICHNKSVLLTFKDNVFFLKLRSSILGLCFSCSIDLLVAKAMQMKCKEVCKGTPHLAMGQCAVMQQWAMALLVDLNKIMSSAKLR